MESDTDKSLSPSRTGRRSTLQSRASKASVKLSLEDFDEETNPAPYLNTPRSLDACSRQGVLPEELMYKSKSSFGSKETPSRILQLRYEHYENARKMKLEAVMREYKNIRDESRKRLTPRQRETGDSSHRSATVSVRSEQDEEQKMIESMHRQIEAMKRKQKEDVESMLLNEFKAERLRQIQDEKMAEKKRKEQALLDEKKQKEAEWMQVG